MKHKALVEPKPLKAFRDKYLAAVMMVAALLISLVSTAQLDSAKYSRINGYGFGYKRFVIDSVFMVPLSTSPHTPYRAGAIRYHKTDSTLQLWTGVQWMSIQTGIGNGVDTAYMVNDTVLTIETPAQDFILQVGKRHVDSIYRKPGQDSIFYRIYGIERAIKDSTGTSISLANVGSGFRLATTPNGSVKSLVFGYGVNGDSTTNANSITVIADTSELVTPSRLNDTARSIRSICQWPAERPLGTLYDKSSWVNTNDFTTAGTATTTLNGSFIDLSGGNGTYGNNYVRLLTPTNLSKWKMTAVIKLTSTLASGSATAFGLHYANSVNPFDLSANFAWTSGSSPIYVATTQGGGTVYQTSGSNISVSTNDVIKVECEFKDSSFVVTATNLTTGSPATTTTYTWATPSDAGGEIPNTCYFSIYAVDGTQQIQAVKIESAVTRYASLALIGDSKDQVGYADNWATRISNQLNSTYGTTIMRAGEGDGVNHVLDGIEEIKLLAPRIAILNIGSNSYRAGFTTPQIIATYDSLTAAIESIGTRVYHIVMPEDTVDAPGVAAGMTFLKEYIAAKYGANYIAGVWDTLAASNRLKAAFDFGDGVHLNQAGVNAVVEKIIQSGKITVCDERLSDDLFARTQIAGGSTSDGGSISGSAGYIPKFINSTTIGNSLIYDNGSGIGLGTTSPVNKLDISGNDATSSLAKFGTFEIQSAADKNGFLGNNGYFNGTNWTRRFAGFGSIMQFYDNSAIFYTVPDGAAGGTTAITQIFSINPGDFTSAVPGVINSSSDTEFGMNVTNSSAGTSAASVLKANNDGGYWTKFGIRGTNQSVDGLFLSGSGVLASNSPVNLAIAATDASAYMNFATGGNTERMRLTASGNLLIGTTSDNGAKMQVNGDATVTDEAYDATAWNGSLEVPTKNAIRDKIESMSSGSSYTFTNGLTESAGTVKFGGTLTENTTITSAVSGRNISYTGISDYLDGPQLLVTNNGSVGVAVHGESTNGRGVEGFATSGMGVYGLATNGAALYGTATTGTALDISNTDASSGNAVINALITGTDNNTIAPWGSFTRATSGTAAAGLGGSFDFYQQNSSGTAVNTGNILVSLTDAAPSTITSKLQINNADNGVVNPVFTIEGKTIQFNQYGSGAITGTATNLAGFTAGGNIIELPLSGFYGSLAVINDADHTVTSTESSIRYHNNITASRTVTLPNPSTATNREVWVKWNTINGGASLNITTTSGTALIYLDGTASSANYNITASFQSALLKSDGTSWYKIN